MSQFVATLFAVFCTIGAYCGTLLALQQIFPQFFRKVENFQRHNFKLRSLSIAYSFSERLTYFIIGSRFFSVRSFISVGIFSIVTVLFSILIAKAINNVRNDDALILTIDFDSAFMFVVVTNIFIDYLSFGQTILFIRLFKKHFFKYIFLPLFIIFDIIASTILMFCSIPAIVTMYTYISLDGHKITNASLTYQIGSISTQDESGDTYYMIEYEGIKLIFDGKAIEYDGEAYAKYLKNEHSDQIMELFRNGETSGFIKLSELELIKNTYFCNIGGIFQVYYLLYDLDFGWYITLPISLSINIETDPRSIIAKSVLVSQLGDDFLYYWRHDDSNMEINPIMSYYCNNFISSLNLSSVPYTSIVVSNFLTSIIFFSLLLLSVLGMSINRILEYSRLVDRKLGLAKNPAVSIGLVLFAIGFPLFIVGKLI